MSSSFSEQLCTELRQAIEPSLRKYENVMTQMKTELEKVKKERDSSNQEVVSLKNTQEVMKLELSKLQDELCRSQELNKRNEMRMEEQKNQEKSLKELYEKVCNENSKMTTEWSKLVSDFEKYKQLVGEYKDKSDLLGKRLEEMGAEKSKLEEKLHRNEMNCKEQRVGISGLIEEGKNLKKRCEDLCKEKSSVIKENETNKQKIWELEQQLEKYKSLNGRVEKLEKEIDVMVHEKLAVQAKKYEEKRFDSGCDGQEGSTIGSKRKKSSVLRSGGYTNGVVVKEMLSSPSASQGVIKLCESDDETDLRILNGTVCPLLPSNQKTKRVRTGERGDSLTNLTAKRRNICRSAVGQFPTGEKPSESLESTPYRIGCLKEGSRSKPISRESPATSPSTWGAEKAQVSSIIYSDSIDLEDDSCSSSKVNEIIDNLRSKNCSGN